MWKLALGLAAASLLLSGCQRIREPDLRAALEQWFRLGQTLHFSATRDCTAFAASLVSPEIRSQLPVIRNVEEAGWRLSRGEAVAISTPSFTATQISERIASTQFSLGLSVINAARAAEPCMTPGFRAGFIEALNGAATILVFDPKTLSLSLVDPRARRVFHTRGAS